jgi:hypothetical protein
MRVVPVDPDVPTAVDARLAAQVEETARKLRGALAALLQEVCGPAARPSRLVQRLGIDKSLASRLVRAVGYASPYQLIHHVPSPTGLRILLDAAREHEAPPSTCDDLERAVDRFQLLIDQLPSGRRSLDTAISGSVAEVRDRAERNAKQAVFRGMSHLLGFQAESMTSALILMPSSTGDTVDGIELALRSGVRRLRPSTPIALFSVVLDSATPSEHRTRLETLDGESGARDPSRYLIPDFTSQPEPGLELFEIDSHLVFALADDASSVDRPVDLASGLAIRNGWRRYRGAGYEEDSRTYLLHYPCKRLIRDLYLRDDLYVGSLPSIRLEFPSPTGVAGSRPTGAVARLNTLDVSAPIEQLGVGLARVESPRVPAHGEMIRSVFARQGLDPGRYRGYRTEIVYPVPMITMGWWFDLPQAPPEGPGASRRNG